MIYNYLKQFLLVVRTCFVQCVQWYMCMPSSGFLILLFMFWLSVYVVQLCVVGGVEVHEHVLVQGVSVLEWGCQ